MSRAETVKQWETAATRALVGRRILAVRYMNEQEVKDRLWCAAPLVLILDDGTHLWPSRDDEGNDAGALFTTLRDLRVIPVIS